MSARRAYFSIPLAVETDRPQKVVTKLIKKILLNKQDFTFEPLSNQQNNINVSKPNLTLLKRENF